MKTSDLCDACEDAQVCELPFLGFGRIRAFAGDIRTVRYANGASILREVIRQPGANQVLVIDGAGERWRALFGDIMAELAMAHRWAGIVVNGCIRDGAEIDAMHIGVKALGTVPRRALLTGRGELDVAVQFGGITFSPGARLVADDDGVVVLPRGVTETSIDLTESLAATQTYAMAR